MKNHLVVKYDIFCNNCKSDCGIRKDYKQGSIVCIFCGFVIENGFIDLTAEYRKFSEDNGSGIDPTRAGGVFHENEPFGGLGTQISLTKNKNENMEKVMNHDEYKRNKIKRKIKSWGQYLQIERKIIATACEKFDELTNKTKLKGKKNSLVAPALLFWAGKFHQSPILLRTLEEISGKSQKDILTTSHEMESQGLIEFTLVPLTKYVENLGNSLDLPFHIVKKSKQFAEILEIKGTLDGRKPYNVASVIVYIVSNCENFESSVEKISKVSDISTTTIKKTCEIVRKNLDFLGLSFSEKEKIESFMKKTNKYLLFLYFYNNNLPY